MQSPIRINVDTMYIAAQSDSVAERFVFAYTIVIENCSASTVQLLRRYWSITDANGKHTEVRGDGVIG